MSSFFLKPLPTAERSYLPHDDARQRWLRQNRDAPGEPPEDAGERGGEFEYGESGLAVYMMLVLVRGLLRLKTDR